MTWSWRETMTTQMPAETPRCQPPWQVFVLAAHAGGTAGVPRQTVAIHMGRPAAARPGTPHAISSSPCWREPMHSIYRPFQFKETKISHQKPRIFHLNFCQWNLIVSCFVYFFVNLRMGKKGGEMRRKSEQNKMFLLERCNKIRNNTSWKNTSLH